MADEYGTAFSDVTEGSITLEAVSDIPVNISVSARA